jgi:phage terminase small subunit
MNELTPTTERQLTAKQRRFVEFYVQLWNASEAARQAGYNHVSGNSFRLLNLPHIQAAIQQRIKESGLVSAEVLARLAQQARLNISEFYIDTPDGPMIDWAAVRAKGHLVKSIEYDRKGRPVLKFHDSQNALIHVGKHLKLFSDQLDVNILSMVKGYAEVSPDDWDKPALES